ncbi:family 20 glycosylhydrolase [Mangrovihabitans endophyticus]|uniref:beta-N-acetylhexosaminidase n=1 Tax=Mangrovihabitans endophyticus TaxID=1751298 RepID=A0A8J3C2X5_9ACTN|nr:family 20 glycosylhydrolase [Mangrovihabitans endophyticus]GGL02283.1 beta-N-acetylhexosaminidase [Mangrovihabitans endophyticus]
MKEPLQLGDVIPVPAQVHPDPDADFTVTADTSLAIRGLRDPVEGIARRLVQALAERTGVRPRLAEDGDLALCLDETDAGLLRLGDEGYELVIAQHGVTLRAAAPAGLSAGAQTLAQLADRNGRLPGGRIVDRPRLPFRGAMLDLARHFFTVDEIKRYIDEIVVFKINHLHLHLTDDQGWRLEIPGWPRLTEVSGGAGTGVDGAGPGFLRAKEYADVVAYAAERFVTVVPEIDMPGHVHAAQVAYPELAGRDEPIAPRTDTEVGYSSLLAGCDVTYAFAEDVIREVARLTPGPFLHIGGDEAQATTRADYQTFLSRVLPLVGKYGKRVVGWHEMAAVDLPEAAVVQYWRIEPADDGVARAAARGSKVIMSPADRTYLDMKYDPDCRLGLEWAGMLDVERAYRWDPAERLPGVGEEALLGVEAPLWSETLRSMADAEFMTFPRLAATAEVGWSPRARRDWDSFRRRLASFGPRWTARGVAFHRASAIDWN